MTLLESTQSNLELVTEMAQEQAIELAKLKMELAEGKADLKIKTDMMTAYKAEYTKYFNQLNK